MSPQHAFAPGGKAGHRRQIEKRASETLESALHPQTTSNPNLPHTYIGDSLRGGGDFTLLRGRPSRSASSEISEVEIVEGGAGTTGWGE